MAIIILRNPIETLPLFVSTERDSEKSFLTTGVESLLLFMSSEELRLGNFSLEQDDNDTPLSDPFDRLREPRDAFSFESDLHGLPLDL